MRNAVVILCLLFAISRPAASRSQAEQPECACPILEQALTDANNIRKGMRRSEVEKVFVEDGGLTFLPKSRYIYRKCHLLKIEVDYEMTTKDKTSADDTVKKVSKLYVELPYAD
jgi:hypothetical protein